MSPDYHRMSYALYRVDGDFGRVVATRNPDRAVLAEGDYIQDRLELSSEAMAYMTDCGRVRPPLLVLTKTGIGILSNRYSLATGRGLYLHIHTRPDSAARILRSGALGYGNGTDFELCEEIRNAGVRLLPRDENAYPALLEALEAVLAGASPLLKTDRDGSITLAALRDGIRKLAAFAGVELTFTLRKPIDGSLRDPHARVRCYRPIMTEGLLLCLLTETRALSATRGGVCRFELTDIRDRDGLALSLRYPVEPSAVVSDEALRSAWHSHMTHVGEQGGLDLWFPPAFMPSRADGGLPERMILLEQVMDPSVLESSDLKARLRLLYANPERTLPAGGESPFP
jgi:hypothetical protein